MDGEEGVIRSVRGCHQHGGPKRLPRGQMKQVDIWQVRLIGEEGGDCHCEGLGVWRSRRAVRGQPCEGALFLDHAGVCGHDLCGLAMQAQRDVVRLVREFLTRRLDAAHDELEVGKVVTLPWGNHQERALIGGLAVQAVTSVEHEYLERRDSEVLDDRRDLVDVLTRHRGEVEPVVDERAAL